MPRIAGNRWQSLASNLTPPERMGMGGHFQPRRGEEGERREVKEKRGKAHEMGVVLEGLKPLYREMRERDLSRCRFAYRRGRVNFDVFFFIDETPFSLLFGARAHNLAFEMAVRQGFEVDTRIPNEQYELLCEALGLRFDPANPFSPRAFLVDFGAALPRALPPDAEPRPHELAIYRPTVDRRDGIYFCGWRDNSVRKEHVGEKNLHKTRALLGFRAYEVCRRKNISSCWSPDPDRAINVVIPN